MIKNIDSYGILKSNIDCELENIKNKVILITSPRECSGKSTIVKELANTISINNKSVLIIDADFRDAELSEMFSSEKKLGFTEYVSKNLNSEDILIKVERNIDLANCGVNENSVLISEIEQFLIDIKEKNMYDYIIINAAALLNYPDARVLAKHVDGSVFVVRKNFTTIKDIKLAKSELDRTKTKFIGAILTDCDES